MTSHAEQHDSLLLKLALVVSACLLVAVLTNIFFSLVIQRSCSPWKSREPDVGDAIDDERSVDVEMSASRLLPPQVVVPVTSAINRQLTVLSHGYEEILDDGEAPSVARESPLNETGEFQVRGTPGSGILYGAHGSNTTVTSSTEADYLPMRAPHEYFLYGRDSLYNGNGESPSLDSIILPPNRQSTCSSVGQRRSLMKPPARPRDSQVYSYAYGSRDGLHSMMMTSQQKQWPPRKFSAESLDSAAELLRRNPQLQSGFLESLARNSSFDSGYADRNVTQRSFEIFDAKSQPQAASDLYQPHDSMLKQHCDVTSDDQSKQTSGAEEATCNKTADAKESIQNSAVFESNTTTTTTTTTTTANHKKDDTPDYENIFDEDSEAGVTRSDDVTRPLMKNNNNKNNDELNLPDNNAQPAPGSPGYIELLPS